MIEYLVDEDILDKSMVKHSNTQPWLDSATVRKAKHLELQVQAKAQTAKHEHKIAMKKLDIESKQNQSI